MAQIILSAAVMDMLHEGHIKMLELMRKRGDLIIMVLHDDASVFAIKGKFPVQSIEQRVKNLETTGLVDHILVTQSIDPADQFGLVIGSYPDDEIIFMRAEDNKDFPGKWLIDLNNIEIEYTPYTKGISSTKLRSEI